MVKSMKKIGLFVVTLICSFFLITNVSAADEKTLNVYLFHGSTCSFCAAEREFLTEIQDEYPYMHVIAYEVWENQENAELLEKVKERLDSDSKGVPFLVVGDRSITGFSDEREQDIRVAIEYYENEEAPDIVSEVLNGIPGEEQENYESTDLVEETKRENYEALIIAGIILFAIAFVIYLYHNSKKLK